MKYDLIHITPNTFIKNVRYFYLVLLLSITMTFEGCKKFIEVDTPSTNLSESNVYDNDATAAAVLTGIYSKIAKTNNFSGGNATSVTSMSYYPSLSADELTLYSGVSNTSLIAYYKNNLTVSTLGGTDPWSSFYPAIYSCNSAIEGLTNAKLLTPSIQKQLLGEAYFLRGFCYFYLVNLYGDVPLILSTDYDNNAILPRSKQTQVYTQILNDLNTAKNSLSDNYLDATLLKITTERVRPTKWAAKALLAKVDLYTNDNQNAVTEATDVINNTALYDTVTLNQVFKKNSKETIWSIQPVLATTQQNTGEGRIYILPATGPSPSDNPVYLSDLMMQSFESGDKRKTVWTNKVAVGTTIYNYPYKYNIGTVNTATQEYIMVLRLAETILVRAEARAKLGSSDGAAGDLNLIRKRSGLNKTSAATPSDLLKAIIQERKVELFTEWGNRWFDLKRTGVIDSVMGTVTQIKGGKWTKTSAFYPIPLTELQRNPFLKQNDGYQ